MEIFTNGNAPKLPFITEEEETLLSDIGNALIRGNRKNANTFIKKLEERVPEAESFLMLGFNNATVLTPTTWILLSQIARPPREFLQNEVGDFKSYLPKLEKLCKNLEACGSPAFPDAAVYAADSVIDNQIISYTEKRYIDSRYILESELELYRKTQSALYPGMSGPLTEPLAHIVIKGDIDRLKEILFAFWQKRPLIQSGKLTLLDCMLYERHLINYHQDPESDKVFILPELQLFSYLKDEDIKLETFFSINGRSDGFDELKKTYAACGVDSLDNYTIATGYFKKKPLSTDDMIHFYHFLKMVGYWDTVRAESSF